MELEPSLLKVDSVFRQSLFGTRDIFLSEFYLGLCLKTSFCSKYKGLTRYLGVVCLNFVKYYDEVNTFTSLMVVKLRH